MDRVASVFLRSSIYYIILFQQLLSLFIDSRDNIKVTEHQYMDATTINGGSDESSWKFDISQLGLLCLLWECSKCGSKGKNIFHKLHFHHWIFNGSCLMLHFLMIFAEIVQYRWQRFPFLCF